MVEESDVRQAQRGDLEAQERLFMACAPELTRFVSRVALGHDDAQDIVQDTFVAAFAGIRRLRQPESFRAWLRQIAVQHLRRRFRSQRLLRRLGFAAGEQAEVEQVIAAEAPPEVISELRRLNVALQALPAEVALALMLRRVEGLQLDEIAEHMNLSRSTVKRRLAEAEQWFETMQEGAP